MPSRIGLAINKNGGGSHKLEGVISSSFNTAISGNYIVTDSANQQISRTISINKIPWPNGFPEYAPNAISDAGQRLIFSISHNTTSPVYKAPVGSTNSRVYAKITIGIPAGWWYLISVFRASTNTKSNTITPITNWIYVSQPVPANTNYFVTANCRATTYIAAYQSVFFITSTTQGVMNLSNAYRWPSSDSITPGCSAYAVTDGMQSESDFQTNSRCALLLFRPNNQVFTGYKDFR